MNHLFASFLLWGMTFLQPNESPPTFSPEDFYFTVQENQFDSTQREKRIELTPVYFCFSVIPYGKITFESYCETYDPGPHLNEILSVENYIEKLVELQNSHSFYIVFPAFDFGPSGSGLWLTNEVIIGFNNNSISLEETRRVVAEYISPHLFTIKKSIPSGAGVFLVALSVEQSLNPLRFVHVIQEDARITHAKPKFIRRIQKR